MWSRAGTGNVGAALAAVGFALGGVMAERGMLAPLTLWLTDASPLPSLSPGLPSLLGLSTGWLVLLSLGVAALLLWRLPRAARAAGQWTWPATGVALGTVGTLAWVTGAPSGWNWGLSVTDPSRSLLEAGLLASPGALNWGLAMLVGLPLGSWVSARLKGPVSWRAPAPSEMPRRLVGGVLMGAGGTLAGGCNIGNALTGLSILAVNSVIATLGIVAGTALAAGLLVRPGEET